MCLHKVQQGIEDAPEYIVQDHCYSRIGHLNRENNYASTPTTMHASWCKRSRVLMRAA